MTDMNMNCKQCEQLLFDFHEGRLDSRTSATVSDHLEHCDACSLLLNDIWQMALVSSRWKEQSVPQWDRFSGRQPGRQWQMPQILATAASILALVMVLTDTRLMSTDKGLTLSFGGGHYVTADEFETFARHRDQDLQQLANRQVASDQLVLRSVIERSREERKEDLSMLVSYVNASQARQYQETEDSLRFLLASQAEDEKDIRQLSEAFQQMGLRRGNNM